jgi:D-alanyl-D-alanine carboxypeptidase
MSLSQRLLALACLILAALLPVAAPVLAQEVPELAINSTRYIVVDAATGQVYAQRGANDQVAIASVTKVFTAVQAMEMAPLDTPITTSDFDLRAPGGEYFGTNGTLMGFGVDETYTMEDMLYGMLLPSGNDAANAIARTLGARPGDSEEEAVQHFMDLLNRRVEDMGLQNTHFMNPHGWGVEGHYSTAADVAAFARLLVNYPTLMEIMGASSYTTSNGALTVTNTNRSLNLFPSVIAGKTGYDWEAGYCLLNVARRDDVQIIAVTLDGVAPNDWYDDNATLLDYGFEQQAAVLAAGGAFDGDVVEFNDPSAAEIARSAKSASEFREVDVPEQSQGVEAPAQQAQPEREPPAVVVADGPEPLARPGIWVAVSVAAAVIGLRGLAAWRAIRGGPARTDPRSTAMLLTGEPVESPVGELTRSAS